MKCEDIGEMMNLEVDGLLSQAEEEALAHHLRLCRACTEQRRQLRKTVQLLATLPRVSVPTGFVQTVMARLPFGKRSPYGLRGALGAALVGILGLILLVLPLAGYGGSGVDYYVSPQTDVELAQANAPLENVLTEVDAAFDNLLETIASVRAEFVVGTCLVLASITLLFLHLMNEAAERPLPTAAVVRIRRVRHHG